MSRTIVETETLSGHVFLDTWYHPNMPFLIRTAVLYNAVQLPT